MEDIYVYFPAKDSASLKTQSTQGNVSLKDCFQISRQFLFVFDIQDIHICHSKTKISIFFQIKKVENSNRYFYTIKNTTPTQEFQRNER